MDATKPYNFIRFGAMDATKPYTFIRFGALDATKPYKFIADLPGKVPARRARKFARWMSPGGGVRDGPSRGPVPVLALLSSRMVSKEIRGCTLGAYTHF